MHGKRLSFQAGRRRYLQPHRSVTPLRVCVGRAPPRRPGSSRPHWKSSTGRHWKSSTGRPALGRQLQSRAALSLCLTTLSFIRRIPIDIEATEDSTGPHALVHQLRAGGRRRGTPGPSGAAARASDLRPGYRGVPLGRGSSKPPKISGLLIKRVSSSPFLTEPPM